MALLFMDGFDAGDYTLKYNTYQTNAGRIVSSTTTRFSVGRSIYLDPVSIFHSYLTKYFTAVNKMICGFAYRPAFLAYYVARLWGDGATVNHIGITTNANGTINILRGGSVIATSSTLGQLAIGYWAYIEISAVVHDTTGEVIVKINGVTAVSFTGDTKNGGTNNSIDCFEIYTQSSGGAYIDDLYVCDDTGSAPYNTFLGDVRVQTAIPTAAGNTTQFTPSTGANYTTVDELPYSATDYVSGVTSGTKDTYQIGDIAATTNTIYGIQTNIIAKKTDAGTANMRPIVRSGSTDYTGTTVSVPSVDKTFTEVRTADPSTSTTWTIAGINAIEAGMEIV